ncbi:uncharacterized protein F4807DRAFT_422263 [Annulohypoxylon truncatum]|uniref:uncharacterized protein n=1 Tax=Annulohypoxylon truncatum TaxID=327061 RepID=UPI002007C9C2|nr:uncharacterized protein F4807DRAFT_422263 [Annulohypoxylon truncatum]KAI1210680.1 hypothetical protein F4807DRAFT_422263 [Annulohypoxylon truncatum]
MYCSARIMRMANKHVIVRLQKGHSLGVDVSLIKISQLTAPLIFIFNHSHLSFNIHHLLSASRKMAPSIDSFIDKQLADRWGPTRNEANAIRDLLHGNINPEDAAVRLTSDINASRSAETAKGALWGPWKLLEDTARKFPEHHTKLVKLVDAIRQLPDLVIRGELAVKWSELPNLAELWGENVFDRDESAYSEEVISIVAFTAQLCARQIVDANDFLSAAELDFYTAFEKTPAAGSALKADDIQRLNINVPIAAQWILHAGEAIYNCEGTFSLEARDGLWTGQPGFSYGRWKLWKERAEWVSGLNGAVRRETIDVARKMVEKMSEIESNDV